MTINIPTPLVICACAVAAFAILSALLAIIQLWLWSKEGKARCHACNHEYPRTMVNLYRAGLCRKWICDDCATKQGLRHG